MGIRVVLADDHKIVRQGLRTLLTARGIEVIAEVDGGKGAVEMARQLSPDVVVMDVVMPELNGIEAAKQIKEGAPGVKVLMLSMHSNRQFITESLRAGASGYLLKDCALEELAHAIRAVVANQVYLSPSVAGVVIADFIRHQPARAK